jgi:hypothetical protein
MAAAVLGAERSVDHVDRDAQDNSNASGRSPFGTSGKVAQWCKSEEVGLKRSSAACHASCAE